jgi:trans-aconitate methyltransferase
MGSSMHEYTDTFRWQGGTVRDDRLVLGEVADGYDDVRPGYQADLIDCVLSWTGGDAGRAVEVGAGTGKATSMFAQYGMTITCLEPDPRMADVLRERLRGSAQVEIVQTRFEQWEPPRDGVSLIYCAQSWHWIDPTTRCILAYKALTPGGVLAVFGHRYLFADSQVEQTIDRVYARWAPQLVDDPATRAVAAHEYWYAKELASCGLFVDVHAEAFDTVLRYPTAAYMELFDTFSSHRLLPPAQRKQLSEAVLDALTAPFVDVQLGTVLVLARRSQVTELPCR